MITGTITSITIMHEGDDRRALSLGVDFKVDFKVKSRVDLQPGDKVYIAARPMEFLPFIMSDPDYLKVERSKK